MGPGTAGHGAIVQTDSRALLEGVYMVVTAKIAVELEALIGLAHAPVRAHDLPRPLDGPAAAVGSRQAGGHGQVQVQADVEHDPAGAHALGVEHPEPFARVVEMSWEERRGGKGLRYVGV